MTRIGWGRHGGPELPVSATQVAGATWRACWVAVPAVSVWPGGGITWTVSRYVVAGLTRRMTSGSVTEAPRASDVVRTWVMVAPEVWFASEKWTETWGSADEPWLASTTVTPIWEVGLSTETVAGTPGGVGRAGGSKRTVRR